MANDEDPTADHAGDGSPEGKTVDDFGVGDEFAAILKRLHTLHVGGEGLAAVLPSESHAVAQRLLALLPRAHARDWACGEFWAKADIGSVRLLKCFTAVRVVVTEKRSVVDTFRPHHGERLPDTQTTDRDQVDAFEYEFFEHDIEDGEESQSVDGSARISQCPECANGKIECRRCSGTGRVECEKCDGDGEVAGQRGPIKCPRCRGNCDVKCTHCQTGRADCPACSGRGKVIQELKVVATRRRITHGAERAHDDLEPYLRLVRSGGLSVHLGSVGDFWLRWKKATEPKNDEEWVAAADRHQERKTPMQDGGMKPAALAAYQADPKVAELLRSTTTPPGRKAMLREFVRDCYHDTQMMMGNFGANYFCPASLAELGSNNAWNARVAIAGMMWPRAFKQELGVVRVREGGPVWLPHANAAGNRSVEHQQSLLAALEKFGRPADGKVVRDYDVLCERAWIVVDYTLDDGGHQVVVGSSGVFSVGSSPVDLEPRELIGRSKEHALAGNVTEALSVLQSAFSCPWLPPATGELSTFIASIPTLDIEPRGAFSLLDAADSATRPKPPNLVEMVQASMAYRLDPDDARWSLVVPGKGSREVVEAIAAARLGVANRQLGLARGHGVAGRPMEARSALWSALAGYKAWPEHDELRTFILDVGSFRLHHREKLVLFGIICKALDGILEESAGSLTQYVNDHYSETRDLNGWLGQCRVTRSLLYRTLREVEDKHSRKAWIVGIFATALAVGTAIAATQMARGGQETMASPAAKPLAVEAVVTPQTQPAPPLADSATHQVRVDQTPLRESASGKAKLVSKLAHGTRVEVLGEPQGTRKKWLRVLVTSGNAQSNSGFVEQDAVKSLHDQ